MEDRDRDGLRDREVERTTIIDRGDRRSGGSGLVVGIIVLVLLAVVLFLLLGDGLGGGDEGDVNVNVEAPEVNLPDIDVPDVNIEPEQTGGEEPAASE